MNRSLTTPATHTPSLFTRQIAAFLASWKTMHDIQWRAPWDEPGKRWVNLR